MRVGVGGGEEDGVGARRVAGLAATALRENCAAGGEEKQGRRKEHSGCILNKRVKYCSLQCNVRQTARKGENTNNGSHRVLTAMRSICLTRSKLAISTVRNDTKEAVFANGKVAKPKRYKREGKKLLEQCFEFDPAEGASIDE